MRVKQLNKLSESLTKPEIKQGFDTLITGFATATAKAIEYAAAIAEGAKATGEFFAKLASGNNLGTEPIAVLMAKRNAAKEELSQINPLVWGSGNRKKELEAEIALLEKQIFLIHKENSLSERYAGGLTPVAITAKRIDTTATDQSARLAAEESAKKAAEAYQKLLALRSSVLQGQVKVLEDWVQSERRIMDALKAGAITAAEAKSSLGDLVSQNLEEIKVPIERIIIKPEIIELDEFTKRLQQQMQDTFTDVFMQIGRGGGRNLAISFLQGIRQILAGVMARDFLRLTGLDKIGQGGGGLLGKLFEKILPGKKSPTTTPAGGRVDPGVDGTPGASTTTPNTTIPGAPGSASCGTGCTCLCCQATAGMSSGGGISTQIGSSVGGVLRDAFGRFIDTVRGVARGIIDGIGRFADVIGGFMRGVLSAMIKLATGNQPNPVMTGVMTAVKTAGDGVKEEAEEIDETVQPNTNPNPNPNPNRRNSAAGNTVSNAGKLHFSDAVTSLP